MNTRCIDTLLGWVRSFFSYKAMQSAIYTVKCFNHNMSSTPYSP